MTPLLTRRAFTAASARGAAALAASLLAAAAVPRARAQPADSRTMRIVVGFPPGQATDAVARLLAERLQHSLGHAVIVENKPGQGGSLAIGQVAKAAPDGLTLTLSALAGYSVNPHLYKSVPYDTLKDLAPIASVADLPLAFVTHPALPAKTLPEVIALARAQPDKLAHPSSGNGTLSHLLMEDLKRRAGVKIMHVPYPGSARAMTDLVAGTVQVGLDTLGATMPLVQGGKLRLLAVGTRQRLPAMAQVPTIAELGFPDFEAVAWVGLTGPAAMPPALRDKLNAEVQAALQNTDFLARMAAIHAYPRGGSVKDFAALLQSEHARWGAVVRQAGVQVD